MSGRRSLVFRTALGRRRAVADDGRAREVRLRRGSEEAVEQSRATGGGAEERRAGAKENAGQRITRRAQNRESVSRALDRVRNVARQRKKGRLTTLFPPHHGLICFGLSFLALKRDAAPGVDGVTWQDYECGSGAKALGTA